MTRARSRPADELELERLIRGSQVLDPPTRRHWLQVLRYLSPRDRQRLADILAEGTGLDRDGR